MKVESSVSATRELLSLWERAATAPPSERDDALLSTRCDVPPKSLGARNAALAGLRAQLFASAQTLRSDCPSCGATSEFVVDCAALSRQLMPVAASLGPQRLAADGHHVEFRLPDITDLREAMAVADDGQAFVEVLLERCVIHCERADGTACAPTELPAAVAEQLSLRMEELEPGASVNFELACPECARQWSAAMSLGDVLWSEVEWRAERVLAEVDALARAYGWSEAEILGLSPTRRAAYLQLLGVS